jgi:oligoendopeptidase F
MIEDEGKPAVDRYIDFLKAGDSLYPLEALKRAGVDLSAPEPIEAGMRMFGEFLDEFEKAVEQGLPDREGKKSQMNIKL